MTPPSSTPALDLGTCACGSPAITLLAGPDGELTVPWHLNCERGTAAFARALAAELASLGDAEFADDLENLAAELDDLCAQRRIEAFDLPPAPPLTARPSGLRRGAAVTP